jgi:formate hydrogenlyase subunit 4
MTLLLAMLAQALHLALMLGMALLLAGLRPWLAARFAGGQRPGLFDPIRAQRRLFAKRPVRAEPGATRAALMPILAFAASLAAAALVPAFTPGLALSPLGDRLVVAGLLLAARLAESVLTDAEACDCAEPALLLALCAAALPAAWVPAAAALAIAATAGAAPGPAWRDGAAADLATLELAAALRRLVFLALLAGLLLPLPAGAGPVAWPGALLAWLALIAAFAALLALGEVAIAPFARPRRREAQAAALLLGIIAMAAGLAAGAAP